MKNSLRILTAAVTILFSVMAAAQVDSGQSFSGFDCKLTVTKTKHKLIKSTGNIFTYQDTIEYADISTLNLLNDSLRFNQYFDKSVGIKITDIEKVSFGTGKNFTGTLLYSCSGLFAGALIGLLAAPQSDELPFPFGGVTNYVNHSSRLGGALIGAGIGALTGLIIGIITAPDSYDDYYINSMKSEQRRHELELILKNAENQYKSEF